MLFSNVLSKILTGPVDSSKVSSHLASHSTLANRVHEISGVLYMYVYGREDRDGLQFT